MYFPVFNSSLLNQYFFTVLDQRGMAAWIQILLFLLLLPLSPPTECPALAPLPDYWHQSLLTIQPIAVTHTSTSSTIQVALLQRICFSLIPLPLSSHNYGWEQAGRMTEVGPVVSQAPCTVYQVRHPRHCQTSPSVSSLQSRVWAFARNVCKGRITLAGLCCLEFPSSVLPAVITLHLTYNMNTPQCEHLRVSHHNQASDYQAVEPSFQAQVVVRSL